MALKVRIIVEMKTNDILVIAIIINHFIKNLDNGGIPAKLAITISRIHFVMFLLASIFKVFILRFFSKYIIMVTDTQ